MIDPALQMSYRSKMNIEHCCSEDGLEIALVDAEAYFSKQDAPRRSTQRLVLLAMGSGGWVMLSYVFSCPLD